MRIAADTNVFVYADSGDDARKRQIARRWLLGSDGNVVMPTQVAGELYNVLTRKARHSREQARDRLAFWAGATIVVSSTRETFEDAVTLATRHKMQIWDALIVTTAQAAGCRVLLSEDMDEGCEHEGLIVLNPFAETPHPRLKALLQSLPETHP